MRELVEVVVVKLVDEDNDNEVPDENNKVEEGPTVNGVGEVKTTGGVWLEIKQETMRALERLRWTQTSD